MRTFIVEVMDESKTEFVETLLSQLEGIAFREKRKAKPMKEKSSKKKIQKTKPVKGKKVKQLFANTMGMWEGRNIDARELRRKTWGIE